MSRPMPFKLEPHVDPPTIKNGFIHDMSTYREHRRQHDIPRSKRLSNAECAAEYWRLKADLCTVARVTDSPIEIDRKAAIMFRFAATPHAH